uniref:ABC membrane transporter n=1 Tax=Trichogramma kaykai TaxID=54128 RepID=A0ABD2VRJ8_9HYME
MDRRNEISNISTIGLGAACPSNYNPADYFIQLLAVVPSKEAACRHAINTVCDKFAESDVGLKILHQLKTISNVEDAAYDSKNENLYNAMTYKASWFEQFRAVLWRSWISIVKEPILIKVRLLQTIMISILIGLIYLNQKLDQDGVMNINGALFIFLTNMTFQNVFAVINVFCSELPVFLRENKNGMYRTDVYFLSKTMAEVPIFLAVPIIFTSVSYFMIGLYPEVQHFFTTVGIVALVANVSTSFVKQVFDDNTSLHTINAKAAAGILDAGIGETQMNILLTSMNIEPVSSALLKHNERQIRKCIEQVTIESCSQSVEKEKSLAINANAIVFDK